MTFCIIQRKWLDVTKKKSPNKTKTKTPKYYYREMGMDFCSFLLKTNMGSFDCAVLCCLPEMHGADTQISYSLLLIPSFLYHILKDEAIENLLTDMV